MAQRGKKYKEVVAKVDVNKEYSLLEAVDLIKSVSYVKFDSSFEAHLNMSYKSIQNIRGSINLPHGTGRKVRVLVFAKGEKAEEARRAGADYVGDDDLLKKVEGGWVDFEFVVSTPDMMKEVGKLGNVLGRKGLMPKPKSGTVTLDIENIVKQLKSGRIEYKSDKTGVVHLVVGKSSFTSQQLFDNISIAFKSVLKDRPSDAKGDYVRSFYIASTMSPSVKINMKELR